MDKSNLFCIFQIENAYYNIDDKSIYQNLNNTNIIFSKIWKLYQIKTSIYRFLSHIFNEVYH